MPWSIVAFVLGVWVLQQCAVLPTPTILAAFALAGVALWLAGQWRGEWRWRLLAIVGAGLIGFAWAGGFAHWRLTDALPAEWEGQDVEVTGVVADLPQRVERGVRFSFVVEQAHAPLPKRIALSWYRQFAPDEDESGEESAAADGLPLPRAGERWRFVVRLKRPHGNVNPQGFDYEGWLFERGIRATGYVRKSALTGRLDIQAGGLSGMIGRWREAVCARIQRTLPDQPYAGVLSALAVGDQQAISPEQWRLFAATGITHLMSIIYLLKRKYVIR